MKRAKETLVIQSPEQVGFHLTLAGLGTRTAAFLLDTLFRWVAVIFLIVAVMLAVRWIPALDPFGFLADLSRTWILALGFTVYGVVELGYFILFEALWNGQTPGKRIQGIRVVRSNGEPIGWTESAVRNVLRAADILGGFYPLGLLVIFLSPKSQRIGDYAAGTVVVIERRGAVPVKLSSAGFAGRCFLSGPGIPRVIHDCAGLPDHPILPESARGHGSRPSATDRPEAGASSHGTVEGSPSIGPHV